jgi:hypothetical protein
MLAQITERNASMSTTTASGDVPKVSEVLKAEGVAPIFAVCGCGIAGRG